MPTSAERTRGVSLVDTSVAVALVVEDHAAHERTLEALDGLRLGLAGHAYFETYSVITRLPSPIRRAPSEVAALLEQNFPDTRFLGAREAATLARRLPGLGIAGGSVYDALVGSVSASTGLTLTTRDARAVDIYRTLDVPLRILD